MLTSKNHFDPKFWITIWLNFLKYLKANRRSWLISEVVNNAKSSEIALAR